MANEAHPWPRPQLRPVREKQAEWRAWMTGDPDKLRAAYGLIGRYRQPGEPRRDVGVIRRALRKWFWGTPATDQQTATGTEPVQIHVPLAEDIADAGSDLVFAVAPQVGVKDQTPASEAAQQQLSGGGVPAPQQPGPNSKEAATQAQLDKYVEDGLIGVLSAAAKIGCGVGGVFPRVTWEPSRRRVFLTYIDPDAADPEFEHGRLTRVTFAQRLGGTAVDVYMRHLEIHEEVDVANYGITAGDDTTPRVEPVWRGIIRHQLWQGSLDDLGALIPITEHKETRHLARFINFDGDGIDTGSPGMCVVYVPNKLPNTLWGGDRDHCGASIGMPDIQGAEPMLDQLDETMSSLMRERDLARARAMVPEFMLETGGPGQGRRFNNTQDVFVPYPTSPTEAGAKPELIQPAIRVDEFLKIAQQLTEDTVRHAGYSAATFGEDEQAATTATEVTTKNSRSRGTRDKKIAVWQRATEALLRKMLAVEIDQGWNRKVDPELVQVTFPQPSAAPLELAQTAATLRNVQLSSIATGVKTAHPTWDDTEVDTEVAAIREELDLGPTVVDGTTEPLPPGGAAAPLMPGQLPQPPNGNTPGNGQQQTPATNGRPAVGAPTTPQPPAAYR